MSIAQPSDHPNRHEWSSYWHFLASCVGYAVGLGNVWRFPYLCYKNGGGTFLIPYTIMLIIEGIPLFFMELSLGQWFQQGAYGTFQKIHPALGGIGIAAGVCTFLVGMYYNMVIAWSFFYFFASMQKTLPWDGYQCPEPTAWGAPNCTGTQEANYWYQEVQAASPSIQDTGSLQWKPTLSLLGAWVVLGACMIKGIHGAKWVVYFTAGFPYVVLVLLFIRGVTLEGAGDGVKFYLSPDFSKLGKSQVWLDAAGQILYSLSPGFGTLIAYASYNKRHNDTLRDALLVSTINCGTSVFAGFVIFSIIGHMAHVKGVSVGDVIEGGPGLAFIAYPEAVLEIPGSTFWALLFFSMLITLGLDSQFGTVEAVVAIMDDLDIQLVANPKWRPTAKTVLFCTVSFLMGLLFCCNAGLYFFQLFDFYSAELPLLFICLCELIAVSWIYGVDKFIENIEMMTGRVLSRWWWYTWKWVTPSVIALILIWSFIEQLKVAPLYSTPSQDLPYPPGYVFFGWCLILSSTLMIPAFALRRKETITFSICSFLSALSLDRLKRELTPPVRVPRGPLGASLFPHGQDAAGAGALVDNTLFPAEIEMDDVAAASSSVA